MVTFNILIDAAGRINQAPLAQLRIGNQGFHPL